MTEENGGGVAALDAADLLAKWSLMMSTMKREGEREGERERERESHLLCLPVSPCCRSQLLQMGLRNTITDVTPRRTEIF